MFQKTYLEDKIVENKFGFEGVSEKIDFGLREVRERQCEGSYEF